MEVYDKFVDAEGRTTLNPGLQEAHRNAGKWKALSKRKQQRAEKSSKLRVGYRSRVVAKPQYMPVMVPVEKEYREITINGRSLDQLQNWSAEATASRASPERETLSFPSEDVEYGLHQRNARKRKHRHAMKQSKIGNCKRQKR